MTSAVEITDEIDEENEKIVFEHSPVRVWRYCRDEEKFRGRGKGKLTIYYNLVKGLAKIIFYDIYNEKTRLLQYIEGDTHCQLDNTKLYHGSPKLTVSWIGTDYTTGNAWENQWNILFVDDSKTRDKFMRIYNFYIDTPNKRFTLRDINKLNQNVKDIVNGYMREIEQSLQIENKWYNVPLLLNYLTLIYYHDPWLNPDLQIN